MHDESYAVANLVSNDNRPVLSLPSKASSSVVDLVINARVATSPEELEATVRSTLNAVIPQFQASANIRALQCFRPGRPVPTHRLN